ncbi:MAG TPA: MarR family transcriptional regulator [Acidimicrobiales bacterium]|nr:MarR family transcriptional regulator [Acidimicrobiales bacterium]
MECSVQPSLRLLLVRAGRQAGHGLREALAPLGLEPRHFLLLRGVGAMAGCSQQAIAAGVEIPPSRMVALVDELEERKLLVRVPNPEDRRAYALRLTPAGRRVLAKAQAVADAHEAALVSRLDPEERATLAHLLSRVTADG